MSSSRVLHHRARIGALSRSRTPNDPELLAERAALREEKLASYIAAVVAECPPLTQETRDRLSQILLRGGDGS